MSILSLLNVIRDRILYLCSMDGIFLSGSSPNLDQKHQKAVKLHVVTY
jgi:hypothetical protein